MMYAYPELVDLTELSTRGLARDERLGIDGPEGIGGLSPLTHASAELGRKIVEQMGYLIGSKAVAML